MTFILDSMIDTEMSQGNVFGLFPTPLGQYKLPPLTKSQYKFVLGQDNKINRSNRISLSKSILEDKLMAGVKSKIESCLTEYFKLAVSSNPNLKLRMTQSWSNYTGVGENHHKHSHSNSVISGVYYVQTLDTDAITFHHKDRSNYHWDVGSPDLNAFNSSSWWMPTPQDSLMLFPSELVHSVSSRKTKDENAPDRISISFNTFYTGEIGNDDDATKLVLP